MQNTAELFGNNLKTLRKKAGLTQKGLAEKLGISEKSISKWEVGAAITPSVLLPDLAKALGIGINALFESNDINYFLGVDGGGTKTEFLLRDTSGKTVNHIILGPSNPVDIGLESCFRVLEEGINTVCSGISKSEISIFAGLAGGISGDNKQSISHFLSRMGFNKFANGSDTENALETALKGEDGVAVIMGTGIIAFSQLGGERKRIGGWGYLIDGGGSGYNLGRDVLEASLKYFDGRGEKTILLSLIERELKGSLPDAIPKIYRKGKSFIAQFAPLVFEAIDKGDCIAQKILIKNIEEVAQIIKVGVSQTGKNSPVVICGGLVSKKQYISPIFNRLLPDIDIRYSEEPMVNGAVALAERGKKNDE